MSVIICPAVFDVYPAIVVKLALEPCFPLTVAVNEVIESFNAFPCAAESGAVVEVDISVFTIEAVLILSLMQFPEMADVSQTLPVAEIILPLLVVMLPDVVDMFPVPVIVVPLIAPVEDRDDAEIAPDDIVPAVVMDVAVNAPVDAAPVTDRVPEVVRDVVADTVPDETMLPDAFIAPETSSFCEGEEVPIPTLPVL